MHLGLGDLDVNEVADEPGGPGEIDPAIVLGASRELGRVLARGTLDEHPLCAADHVTIARLRVLLEQRLQPYETSLLVLLQRQPLCFR